MHELGTPGKVAMFKLPYTPCTHLLHAQDLVGNYADIYKLHMRKYSQTPMDNLHNRLISDLGMKNKIFCYS